MLENATFSYLQLYYSAPFTTVSISFLVLAGSFLGKVEKLRPLKQSFPVVVSVLKAFFISLSFIICHSVFYSILTKYQFVQTEYSFLDQSSWPYPFFNFIFFSILGMQAADIIYAFFLKRYMKSAEKTVNTISGLLRGVIYCSAILLAWGAFSWQQGYSFTGVWVSTGLATALIGLALQQILGDFFSGIALGMERSLHMGDWIQLDNGTVGEIIDINWRATMLRGWDLTRYVIPNSKLAKQGFNNLGNQYTKYKPWYQIKLPAEIDPRFAKQLLLEGMYRCKHVLKHPTPVVRLEDASTVPYTYMCWVTFANYPIMFIGREELYREIHYVLQQAGVHPAVIASELRMKRADVPVAEPPTIQLALKSQPVFSSLDDNEIEKIAAMSEQKHYDAGMTIDYGAGEVDAFDIIISGIIEVSTDLTSMKKIVIGELGPGESYGLVSMFTDNPIPMNWTAQTDVALIRIDFASMKELMLKYPDVADRIAVVVKQKQDEAEHLRLQNTEEPSSSSLGEIKRYIRSLIRRGK